MTTQYQIEIIRFDEFGTDVAERVALLSLATTDPALVAMNLRALADSIDAGGDTPPAQTGEAKPMRTRKQRSDAGRPRQRFEPEPPVEPGPALEQPVSPFSIVATAQGGTS